MPVQCQCGSHLGPYCSRKMMRALVRSYGESSTETLSPGTIRIKCLRILPEIWASTFRWPARSTRNIVPGKTWVTVPSITICSSFGIAPKYIREQGSLKVDRLVLKTMLILALQAHDLATR